MITTIEGAIEQRLKATTAVTDLVGSQIYANIADQRVTDAEDPYLVIIMDTQEDVNVQGSGSRESDIMIYIDIYHNNLGRAIGITDQVRAALQDYTGTHGSVIIQEMWQTDKTMARSEEVNKHIYRMEFMAMIITN